MTIRPYAAADAPLVRGCIAELQERERRIDGRLRPGDEMAAPYLEAMLGHCRRYAGVVLVAEESGTVAGFATVLTRVPYEGLDDWQSGELEERYPEIGLAGGLAVLLRRELAARRGAAVAAAITVSTPGSPYWVVLEAGDRTCQLTVALRERLFLNDFWEQHVRLGFQSTPAIRAVVETSAAWLIDRVAATALAREVPSVALEECAEAYEAGPDAYIAHAWRALRAYVRGEATHHATSVGALLRVVDLAAAHPRLRRMLPYTSLHRFSISRGLTPRTHELPLIAPARGRPGRFHLTTYEERVLAEGSAAEMVALLASHLPAEEDEP